MADFHKIATGVLTAFFFAGRVGLNMLAQGRNTGFRRRGRRRLPVAYSRKMREHMGGCFKILTYRISQ
ncbi:MAG: hypothetical protein LBR22_08165 [Desulfovibrio sp.]|nr:hypothetical protein [Desulfovibrio sp.]